MIRALGVGLLGLVAVGSGSVVCVAVPWAPLVAVLAGGPLVVAGAAALVWAAGS